MAHESFEDEATAAIMNREFVNIKVDREERPDVDRVYMTFVQATTGGGGWPMSVWLTPDLKPFVGGTYFPPEDRHGQPGFKKVLGRIASAWKQDHKKIAEQRARRLSEALRESQTSQAAASGEIDNDVFQKAYEQFDHSYDPNEGGFGNAPKFPRPVAMNFLARFSARDAEERIRQARVGNGVVHIAKNGRGRNARSYRRRIPSIFGRSLLARPAFRKNALRSSATSRRLSRCVSDLNDPHLHPLPGQGEADAKAPVRVEFEAAARDILDYVRSRHECQKMADFFPPKMPIVPFL